MANPTLTTLHGEGWSARPACRPACVPHGQHRGARMARLPLWERDPTSRIPWAGRHRREKNRGCGLLHAAAGSFWPLELAQVPCDADNRAY
jgi:hypothetical protein